MKTSTSLSGVFLGEIHLYLTNREALAVLCSVVKLVGSGWNKKEVHFFQLTKRKAGKKVREMVVHSTNWQIAGQL